MNDQEILKNGFGLYFFFEEIVLILLDIFIILVLLFSKTVLDIKTLFMIAGYILLMGSIIVFVKSFIRWKKVKKEHNQILKIIKEQDRNLN